MTKISVLSQFIGDSPHPLLNFDESETRITKQHLFYHSSLVQPGPQPLLNYDESKMGVMEQHLISSQKQYAADSSYL